MKAKLEKDEVTKLQQKCMEILLCIDKLISNLIATLEIIIEQKTLI